MPWLLGLGALLLEVNANISLISHNFMQCDFEKYDNYGRWGDGRNVP